jgi:hypothetical protein
MASNAGAGTANAIIATTSIPIPAADGAALIALPIVADNTSDTVTVIFNGGSALIIKTNSGVSVPAGGLVAGQIVAGYKVGSDFRLLSDIATSADRAAAEAAASAAASSATDASTSESNAADSAAAAATSAASVDADNLANKAATRVALKAFDGTTFPAVYLYEEGREGVFNWRGGDLSTFVSADTQEGIYVAPSSDATGASGAWVRQHDGVLRPEWFGALAITDWSTPEDSTDALASLAAVSGMVPAYIELSGFYRSTSPIALASVYPDIRGIRPGKTGFFFDGCNGITVDYSTSIWNSASFKDVGFITNGHSLYTALSMTGAANTGDGALARIDGCFFLGRDVYPDNTPTWLDEWLVAISLEQCDGIRIEHCAISGSAYNSIGAGGGPSGFPYSTRGIIANNCTHMVVNDCHILGSETGILLTGNSEGLKVNFSVLVANKNAMSIATTGTANAHAVVDNHMASFVSNLKISGGSFLHTIAQNVFFRRDDLASGSFVHISLDNCPGTRVLGNQFYVGAAGADALENIGVDLLAGSKDVLIFGNKFIRQRIPLRQAAGVGINTTIFADNHIEDNANTSGYDYISDGIGGLNVIESGTVAPSRATAWDNSKSGVRNVRGSAHRFYTPAGLSMSVTNIGGTVVNYIDFIGGATGSGPVLRVLGTDASIDFNLEPKGTGVVKSGRPIQGANFRVAGTQVVGEQGAAVADATDAATVITQLNALLAQLRTHGLIAT